MPIFEGSRYEGQRFTAFVDRDGTTRRYVHPRVPLTAADLDGDFQLVAKAPGDELDQIAFNVGGRERLWWVVAEVSGIQDPFEIPDGTDLTVPSKAQFGRLK